MSESNLVHHLFAVNNIKKNSCTLIMYCVLYYLSSVRVKRTSTQTGLRVQTLKIIGSGQRAIWMELVIAELHKTNGYVKNVVTVAVFCISLGLYSTSRGHITCNLLYD
jgi:hypothetical protein